MLKLLIGGSPCTRWSIAQSKARRETEPSGEGWELFRNYLIAKEKFKPDLFLYENNKSAPAAVKAQIALELSGGYMQHINSALVSAQNRQRFYVHNFGELGGPVPEPEDRGILLKDVLESGMPPHYRDKSRTLTASYGNHAGERDFCEDMKGSGLGCQGVPVRVGDFPNSRGEIVPHRGTRIYSAQGKSVAPLYPDGGQTDTNCSATGLYAITADGGTKPVYPVRGGKIEIKGKLYPIKLPDGWYIIRKLTVTECCRLQTLPDGYCRAVSATQAYKALGNGWTAEVIIHLLSYALDGVSRGEPLQVLSMYDGIGTGRYCLDRLGFTNVEYRAYEIDKYAIQIAASNYPDIIQCGDAFAVREEDWRR